MRWNLDRWCRKVIGGPRFHHTFKAYAKIEPRRLVMRSGPLRRNDQTVGRRSVGEGTRQAGERGSPSSELGHRREDDPRAEGPSVDNKVVR
jgi:hypothetical protein